MCFVEINLVGAATALVRMVRAETEGGLRALSLLPVRQLGRRRRRWIPLRHHLEGLDVKMDTVRLLVGLIVCDSFH